MKSIFRTMFGKAVLATVALGGFLLLAGAPGASARDWDNCHRRVTYTDGVIIRPSNALALIAAMLVTGPMNAASPRNVAVVIKLTNIFKKFDANKKGHCVECPFFIPNEFSASDYCATTASSVSPATIASNRRFSS